MDFDMGTPLPPNERGDLCNVCWGPGKPFGDTPTPHVIIARLTSLLPGEFWDAPAEQLLLVSHYLEQKVAPCEWSINDGSFVWDLNYNVQHTDFDVWRISDHELVFRTPLFFPCAIDLPNSLVDPAGNVAYNGFVNFTWDPEDL
ncbi:unnamed protein product [marine sediment metagenome]|uniref:Uncharacterized protein n=1 Tax=marine sediment metagenome TaxID=412755 RepID=X1IZI0_9ZZZZ